MWVREMAIYFVFIRMATASAAEPVCQDVYARQDVTRVSTAIASHVNIPTVLSGNEGKAFEAFSVVSKQPCSFFYGRNVGPFERSPNEIIDLMVARRSASTNLTRHAVCSSGAHCCATRSSVRFTEVTSKTQPGGDTNGLVAHTKTA